MGIFAHRALVVEDCIASTFKTAAKVIANEVIAQNAVLNNQAIRMQGQKCKYLKYIISRYAGGKWERQERKVEPGEELLELVPEVAVIVLDKNE